MLSSVLGLTANSRRISAQYLQFAGKYDLAVAAKERVLVLMQEEFAEIELELQVDNIERYLSYIEGNFVLGPHLLNLLRVEKHIAAEEFLAENFGRRAGSPPWYYLSYSIGTSAGTYRIRSYLWRVAEGFDMETLSYKTAGYGINIRGRLQWPTFEGEAKLIPTAYEWRGDAPMWFQVGSYPLANIPGNFAVLPAQAWQAENAVFITNSTMVHTAEFSEPTIIIHTGAAPLLIYAHNGFEGIIISQSNTYIVEGTIKGAVISTGNITWLADTNIVPQANLLFYIPMAKEMQREIFEFLGLTRFGSSENTNAEWLLGDIRIADFQLDISLLEDLTPILTHVKLVDYRFRRIH